ncbi:MAG TPA: amino acid adenylation domain-containing protein, partial [Pyrinomonadaceae bacterium]
PMQYADFAAWQRGWLQGEVLQAQTDYWKKKLGGLPALELQTDRPRPRQRTYAGGHLTFSLPPGLTSALYDLSRRENVTLYMTLLAAFQTLLYRHTGQTDFGVGTPLANRNRSEVEGLIGFFLNTIVMRCDLSGDPTFRELLARVRETSLGAYAHQELPFEKLVEELQPERSLSRNPLFQVMFVLRTTSESSLTLPGITVEPLDFDAGIARFDLETMVNESESGLGVLFRYNTDLFEEATIARMWGHFSNILEGVVADPEQKVSALPLLTEDERRMLVEWNQTGRDYPKEQTVARLFEEQAGRTPEATAVRFAGDRLTYRELNGRANRLAHHLRSLGIGAESLVAVCMERSVEMVVALLGVLKAGGAYVPLDPEYPRQRLDFIIEETQAPLLLTQEHLRERIAPGRARVVALDAEAEAIAGRPTDDLAPQAHADNLAYVIYTSGSTGRPKGVAIAHRSAAAFIDWVGGVFTPEQLAGVLASTSICFDLSVFEIFGTLCHGGAVILAKDALQLPSLDAAGEVTLVNTVPSAMAELVRAEAVPPSVTTINLAGEPLQNALAQQAYGRGNVTRVFNLYGPSEDTTYSTFSLVQKGGERQPTIGRPVANTQLYILDKRLQPVPVGVPGELCLGGAGLARGYLKRPGLSAEKFIPNPFSREPGARLYRTGDSARLLANGDVEFMGRSDDQVKVRGFRIELGEVEAVLAAHEGVRQCAAAVRGEGVSDKWLVAYVVPARDGAHASGEPRDALTSSELRGFMRERVPEYMVPSAFVLIDALPLTENGKVNRRALPEPGQERVSPGNTFVAPRTVLERVIADIWAEVLGLSRVGVEDNFFDLGGHSLLATQVTTRLSEIFQVELPVRNTFETPTVAGLAQSMERDPEHAWQYGQIAQALGELEELSDEEAEAMLERERPTAEAGRGTNDGGKRSAPLSPAKRELLPLLLTKKGIGDGKSGAIPRRPDSDPCPLSFAQERIWFFEQLESGTASYNVPAAVRATGRLDVDVLRRSLGEILRRHEALRTAFEFVGGRPLQRVLPVSPLPLPVFDLRGVPPQERDAQAMNVIGEEVRRSFDLTGDPLLRCALLRLDEDDHVVLLTLHHIASDGWSSHILVSELTALYEAFAGGRPSPLAELPIQYADFAVWQRGWLRGERLEGLFAYWEKQLEGAPAKLKLATDRPRPPARTLRGARRSLLLTEGLTLALKELCRREDVTPFMLLLAAFKTLLYRYTWQEDIVVGTPIANRRRREVEGLIGFFVNTLALRTDLSGNPTFRALLARVRETTLGAYAHQDMPFDKLVEMLRTERDLSHDPLFQVFFALNNNPAREAELPDVTLSGYMADNGVAKFDLEVSLVERDGRLVVNAIYKEALFDAATIDLMLERYRALLEGVVADPDARLLDLPLGEDAREARTAAPAVETADEFTFDDW